MDSRWVAKETVAVRDYTGRTETYSNPRRFRTQRSFARVVFRGGADMTIFHLIKRACRVVGFAAVQNYFAFLHLKISSLTVTEYRKSTTCNRKGLRKNVLLTKRPYLIPEERFCQKRWQGQRRRRPSPAAPVGERTRPKRQRPTSAA